MTKFVKTWLPLVPLLKIVKAQGSGEYFSGDNGVGETSINKVEPDIRDVFLSNANNNQFINNPDNVVDDIYEIDEYDTNLDGFSSFKTEDPFYDYFFQPDFNTETITDELDDDLSRKIKKTRIKKPKKDKTKTKKPKKQKFRKTMLG